MNDALSFGLMSGLATFAAGPLYDRFGAGGYWAMAASAAVGLAGAVWLLRSVRRT